MGCVVLTEIMVSMWEIYFEARASFETWILAEEVKLSAAVDLPDIKLQNSTDASYFNSAVL